MVQDFFHQQYQAKLCYFKPNLSKCRITRPPISMRICFQHFLNKKQNTSQLLSWGNLTSWKTHIHPSITSHRRSGKHPHGKGHGAWTSKREVLSWLCSWRKKIASATRGRNPIFGGMEGAWRESEQCKFIVCSNIHIIYQAEYIRSVLGGELILQSLKPFIEFRYPDNGCANLFNYSPFQHVSWA